MVGQQTVVTKVIRGAIGLALVLSLSPREAKADPCEAALGGVDPGGAAAVRANENSARQKANEAYDHAKGQNGDAQWKPEDSGRIADAGANHHSFETPYFAAGIAKAMMKGDFKTASTLTLCVQKRSAQSSADQDAARRNHEIAERARQGDPNAGSDAYRPRVVSVESIRGEIR